MVSGTDTGVGKTFVAAAVLRGLVARLVPVAARKPVQSFDPAGGPTDAELLAAATGEPAQQVCPAHRWLALPMAPPMAAEALGRPPFTLAELVAELDLPAAGVTLVEGVGGPRSPLAADGDTVALADALGADPVVLVADAGLGVINAVRLAAAAFGGRPLVVALNRFDPDDGLHARNRAWLAETDRFDVVTTPAALADRLAGPPGTPADRLAGLPEELR